MGDCESKPPISAQTELRLTAAFSSPDLAELFALEASAVG